MEKNSDTILTQILLLVQDLHQSLGEYGQRVAATEQAVEEINQKLTRLVEDGFLEADVHAHRRWHERHQFGPIRRWLLKRLKG